MPRMSEGDQIENIRPDTIQRLNFADRVIVGEYGQDYPNTESLNPVETFSGLILDLNDENLTEEEKSHVLNWIDDKLGSKPENSPVRAKYMSADGKTKFEMYDVEIGDGWYLSRWQNANEEPSYIFWPQEVYDWQLEADYKEVK